MLHSPPCCWKHGHDPGSANLEGGQRQQGLGESFNAPPGICCFGWLIVQVKHQLKRVTKTNLEGVGGLVSDAAAAEVFEFCGPEGGVGGHWRRD